VPNDNGRARSLTFDALLALGLTFLNWTIAIPLSDNLDGGVRVALLALITIHTGALVIRRVAPWVAFAVNLTTALMVVIFGFPLVVLTLAPLVMLYSLASQRPGRQSSFALGASLVALVVGQAIHDFPDDLSTSFGNVMGLSAAWLIGWFVYRRQEYVRVLEARTAELQEAREELARTAVTEERLRIARELHDIVAHSLSMIAVQSGVGAHVIDSKPEEAKAALANVERASRDALNEMRALLGMLRNEDGETGRAPLPGLAELPGLIEQVGRAGTQIDLRVRGEERALPSGLDLTAYRVIQESLTNVVRHAEAERARVSIDYGIGSLVIEIVDDGRAVPATSSNGGLGIEGMRERLAAFGGSLETGPLAEGGFRVRAELPVPETTS
jgi:signal transduction histidine kinase